MPIYQFIRLLSEECGEGSQESAEKELALANGIKAMTLSLENSHEDFASQEEKHREYEHACREKFKTSDKAQETESQTPGKMPESESQEDNVLTHCREEPNPTTAEEAHRQAVSESDGKPLEEMTILSYSRKVTVLYELLVACLADAPGDEKVTTRQRKGYDARHRVALRLLSAWFDLKWVTMVRYNFC